MPPGWPRLKGLAAGARLDDLDAVSLDLLGTAALGLGGRRGGRGRPAPPSGGTRGTSG
ncbi:MAG: hypothetical protein U0790_18710 [Isosphaeraceae bacterium]